jgi:hypothetical protein
MSAPVSTTRHWLVPREHGAYAQLALPLAAAYAGGWPGAAACLFGLAAIAAFLAHEPLLIRLHHRGKRAFTEAGQRAGRRLAVLAIVGVGAAGLAAYLAPAAAAMALLPAFVAVVLAAFIFKRRERTVAAEILASAALGSAALPVAVASGWHAEAALSAFAGWIAGFAAVTSVVWPIAHKRTVSRGARAVALLVPALVVVLAVARLGAQAAAAGAPLVVTAVAIAALRPAARLLRPLGWTVAAVSVAQAVAVVVVTR